MTINWKTVGITLTIIGGLLSLAQGFCDDKILDDKIAEAVAKAMRKEKKNESI